MIQLGYLHESDAPQTPIMGFYTSAGEIMTFNTLRVTATTADTALSKAVIARIATSSHTVLECYGTTALTVAVRVSNITAASPCSRLWLFQ